jgi:hypothetical protein
MRNERTVRRAAGNWSGCVEENISYGRPDAKQSEIEAAAHAANAVDTPFPKPPEGNSAQSRCSYFASHGLASLAIMIVGALSVPSM